MKQKTSQYTGRRDSAVAQDERVKKVLAGDIPKGAKTYIERRKADLKKVRGY